MNSDNKIKIFVSAYACEPGKGSEIGVGWHWVLEMSKYFELWVLTRANNQKPIEEYFEKYPDHDLGIHWIYYDCPNYIKRFKHQMKGVRTYYTIWQRMSNNVVQDVMKKNSIPIYHLLTYGNAIWEVSKFGQKQFFIWGPTGGVDTIPREFSSHYSFKHRIVEWVRRIVVSGLKISPSFYRKCKNADLIFCKASSTMQIIPEKYRSKAKIFTDVAMESGPDDFTPAVRKNSEGLTFITVGRLDGWRGFDLLIEAFARAADEMPFVKMKIIGTGAEENNIKKQIQRLKMDDKIILTGQLSMEEYRLEMEKCDAVLNACLKEGGVTNAFDCMTFGKPLLCIDTGGYTRNFDEECAIILNRSNREEIIMALKSGMIELCNEHLRQRMSMAMVKKGSQITWEIKGKQIYHEIIRSFNKTNGGID